MLITTKLIMSWNPCDDKYPEERIRKLIGDGKTPLEIAHDKIIPVEDTCWILLHPEIIPENELYELACKFAEDALIREREAGREPDKRSWAAIEAKRKWMRGEITDQALDAAGSAALTGAWFTAWSTALAVAWATSRVAARDTAWAAAWAAAGSAAWDRILSQIIVVIEKQQDNS